MVANGKTRPHDLTRLAQLVAQMLPIPGLATKRPYWVSSFSLPLRVDVETFLTHIQSEFAGWKTNQVQGEQEAMDPARGGACAGCSPDVAFPSPLSPPRTNTHLLAIQCPLSRAWGQVCQQLHQLTAQSNERQRRVAGVDNTIAGSQLYLHGSQSPNGIWAG